MAQRHPEQKIKDSHFNARKRDGYRRTIGGSSERCKKKKAKNMPITTPIEGTAYVGPQKAHVHLEMHAHSSMTPTRRANGRDGLVHLLRQVHHTEIRKVMENVVMTEMQKGLKNLQFVMESKQTTLCKHQEKKSPEGVNSTPTNTARTELHSMITFHHANTRGSRTGKLRIAHLFCLNNNCYSRVMSHSSPHLTLTTSTSSLSSISRIFSTISPTHTRPSVHNP